MSDPALQPQRLTAEAAQADEHPADRVFLSNYVRAIEIGAYAEEHGVTQRVRFDIVLEVARNTAHLDDRVGRVVNYDDLVEAVETLAQGERLNLLETFAERLAHALLIDPRARRVTVRLEKLDRLPGGAAWAARSPACARPRATRRSGRSRPS